MHIYIYIYIYISSLSFNLNFLSSSRTARSSPQWRSNSKINLRLSHSSANLLQPSHLHYCLKPPLFPAFVISSLISETSVLFFKLCYFFLFSCGFVFELCNERTHRILWVLKFYFLIYFNSCICGSCKLMLKKKITYNMLLFSVQFGIC